MLLTRNEFRAGALKRDNNRCVICKAPAQDVHHIIERRLFDDGGYYLENAASLCGQHHIEAERTTLSCDIIREATGISNVVLPPHLYEEYAYDKWGNIIMPNNTRIKGELFYDESVQKILTDGGVLSLFSKYVKHPRIHHVPWSADADPDDRFLDSTEQFVDCEIVVTEKMDGEQTTMYDDHIHARSVDGESHPSQSYVRQLHSRIGYNIPENWRVCGENMYAKHSILYHDLESYFYVHSIWNDRNECLSWDDTVTWAKLLDLEIVPLLYRGLYDEKLVKSLHKSVRGEHECEGYVMRIADAFSFSKYRKCVGKYRREGHLKTAPHNWKRNQTEQNQLKSRVDVGSTNTGSISFV